MVRKGVLTLSYRRICTNNCIAWKTHNATWKATTNLPLPVKLSTCKHFSVAYNLEASRYNFLISSECRGDNAGYDAFGLWDFWILVKWKWRSSDIILRFRFLKVDIPTLLVF